MFQKEDKNSSNFAQTRDIFQQVRVDASKMNFRELRFDGFQKFANLSFMNERVCLTMASDGGGEGWFGATNAARVAFRSRVSRPLRHTAVKIAFEYSQAQSKPPAWKSYLKRGKLMTDSR